MLFNSFDFAIFLPIVFIIYWFIVNKSLKLQNFFLLSASYVFYGWWDWRFLSLIVLSTIVDFYIDKSLKGEENLKRRKLLLCLSLAVNLGFLGFFKYFDFFVDNFKTAFSFFGVELNGASLNIILPVGISFYTFQTLSYTIDVYKKKLEPTDKLIDFAAYVSFFPQLVAGPIERAINLLPQFATKRVFNYKMAVDGMRQILWGLFKKVVIADNCATFVNLIFESPGDHSGITLLLGGVLFAFQIYGDFSGYSDIAIGTSRLFGFNLMKNFAFPYFSRDIAEFWRRWHISLSTWFRDYLYIPLGGSRGSNWKKIRNVFIIFIVSGFWHGANWTFIFWGFLNALYFLPLLLLKRNRKNLGGISEKNIFPSISEFIQISTTFLLTVFAWIFFRANSISDAFLYYKKMFSDFFALPSELPSISISILLLIFIIIEWMQRDKEHGLELSERMPSVLKWTFYILLIIAIDLFGGSQQQFIYFQF
jgi:D-alanyl-lipoteichoic acid acyltransferase DltB (MBOAT superfamily)